MGQFAGTNAVVLEHLAHLASQTLQINPSQEAISRQLLDKHFFRKHGVCEIYLWQCLCAEFMQLSSCVERGLYCGFRIVLVKVLDRKNPQSEIRNKNAVFANTTSK